jgi:succinyl-diaminopimelate desuccinylase
MSDTGQERDAVGYFPDVNGPIELTRTLVSKHTVTESIDPAFVDVFSEWLTRVGFTVTLVEAGGIRHILAAIGPDSPKLRVAFVGHYDTVPLGDNWRYPPLGATEENGVLYGRGASDMKSGDAAMIFAATELAQEGVHSTIFLPGDEETTSLGIQALLDAVPYSFDYCICGEPTSKTKLGDCLKIGRRGRIAGTVTLRGEAGHAAYAHITPNIIHAVPGVVQALSTPWNDRRFGTETTLSITNITTDSTAVNVIPGSVTLTFDARFAPGRAIDEIEAEIEQRLKQTKTNYQLTIAKRSESYLTDINADPDSSTARFVQCAVREIENSVGVTPEISCDGGASDARFVAAKGVPTIEFGVPHGKMHGPDEFVEVKNIELVRDTYVRIIRAVTRATGGLRSAE